MDIGQGILRYSAIQLRFPITVDRFDGESADNAAAPVLFYALLSEFAVERPESGVNNLRVGDDMQPSGLLSVRFREGTRSREFR